MGLVENRGLFTLPIVTVVCCAANGKVYVTVWRGLDETTMAVLGSAVIYQRSREVAKHEVETKEDKKKLTKYTTRDWTLDTAPPAIPSTTADRCLERPTH